nr:FAD-dependent oxidoreductase [Streptomyces tailanensis]
MTARIERLVTSGTFELDGDGWEVDNFVLARCPEHPQVIVACGLSGHGFTFVPVIGEILADLATVGASDHPIALFDPRRVRI